MHNFYKAFRFFLAFVIIAHAGVLKAQVPATAAGYAFYSYNTTFTPISGGTQSTATQGDDVNSGTINIGFTFPFAGTTNNQVVACSNGWLKLGTTTSGTQTNSTGNATTLGPILMPLWDDMHAGTGTAWYQTTGAAPNRVFTFEWRQWRWYWSASGNNMLSIQVKLYENGRIEFIYAEGATPVGGATSATIGIAKSGTDYQTLNNSTPTATPSTTTFTTNITTRPVNGQVYAWDAPCAVPTALSVTNITHNSVTIGWNAVTGSLGYEYFISQSPTPPASGTNTSLTSINVFGLQAGTNYYLHVRNRCASNFSSWVTVPFATKGCHSPTNLLIKYVYDTTASMLWSAMPDADYYQYALSFSSQAPTTGIVTTTGLTTTFNGLVPNSKYYFFLRATCFGTDSSSWKRDSFVTLINCYPPVVKVNLLGSNEPYAFWDPVPTAFNYEYAVTTSKTPPAFGTETFNTFVNILLKDDDKSYYLHVRTKCSGENSMYNYSTWSTTTLRDNGTNVNTLDNKTVNIYPNPAKDVLNITGIESNGSYAMTDVTGRTAVSGAFTGSFTIAVKNLPAGIYILKLQTSSGEYRKKIIKE